MNRITVKHAVSIGLASLTGGVAVIYRLKVKGIGWGDFVAAWSVRSDWLKRKRPTEAVDNAIDETLGGSAPEYPPFCGAIHQGPYGPPLVCLREKHDPDELHIDVDGFAFRNVNH